MEEKARRKNSQSYFTKQELIDFGFKYQGLTKEDDFQYDWWSLEIFGAFIDVTFSYNLNSTDIISSIIEINNYALRNEITKEQVIAFINFLKNS